MNLIDEIKKSFKNGDVLTRLIYVNLAVFVVFNLVLVFALIFKLSPPPIFSWFMLPASPTELMMKPWTLITYMFLHKGFWHVVINMFWLYFGGKLFLQYFDGKRMLSVYFLGGLSGAALYILAFNLLPAFSDIASVSKALGASASVLAIMVAIATYIPNFRVQLFLFGKIQLKYIAIAAVVIDLLSMAGTNAGGHIAHLGGAIFGFYFSRSWLQGKDISQWFSSLLDGLISVFVKREKKAKMKVKYKRNQKTKDDEFTSRKKAQQDEIDAILDKIAKTGYDSLSKEEKDTLFRMSKE